MRSAISAAAPAALALLAPVLLLTACDQAKPRPDTHNANPLPAAGASGAAPVASAAGLPPALSTGLPARPEFPAFYLDRIGEAKDPINSPAVVRGDGPIQMSGFGFDVVANAPAKGVDLDVDGKLYGTAYGSARPDVAAVKKAPGLTATGYTVTLPTGSIAPGAHKVRVRVVTADGSAFYQSPAIGFTVQ